MLSPNSKCCSYYLCCVTGSEKENSDPQSGRNFLLHSAAANVKSIGLLHTKNSNGINSCSQKSEKRSFGTLAPSCEKLRSSGSSFIAEPPTKKRAFIASSDFLAASNVISNSVRRYSQAENFGINEETVKQDREVQGIRNWLNFMLRDLQPTNNSIHSNSAFQTLQFLRVDQQRRNALSSIAQSQYMSVVWDNLDKEIRDGRITMRPDSNMFCDFGLRDKLLQIIFSFEIIWLRPALEIVFKCNAARSHSNDTANLYKFVVNRLSKTCDVKAKLHSKSYDSCSSPQFYKEFNQYVLSSFLRLVTLLDRCKNCKVIERNPCLFTKSSEIRFGNTLIKPLHIKATKEVVTNFSKEFLGGEGDIVRHLSLLGVNLTFQQCALDEYEFSVSNLVSDLRDGVILTKVVDMMSGKSDELSSKLRVPAISRLQKVT